MDKAARERARVVLKSVRRWRANGEKGKKDTILCGTNRISPLESTKTSGKRT
jgi:hypothetical protein